MVAGSAISKLMQQIGKEQEVLMNLADMLIELYVSESTQLRVEKLVGIRGDASRWEKQLPRHWRPIVPRHCQVVSN